MRQTAPHQRARAHISHIIPLLLLLRSKHAEVARALLSAGASIDLQDNLGRSPLQFACFRRHMEVVHVLLSAGARADLRDNNLRAVHCLMP